MISLRKLQVRSKQGRVLVAETSIEVAKPMIIGIFGPNGSGKTSLLKTMAGIEEDREIIGESWIEKSSMVHGRISAKERVKNVLYLGSDFYSAFQVSVRELLEMARTSNPGSKTTIPEIAELFDLTSLLNRSFSEMSDGEKQRAMMARGILQAPKWLILDETFSKMDMDRSVVLGQILREFVKTGFGILVSSHDLNLLSEIADELWLMKEGRIIATGKVEDTLTSENLQKLYPMRMIHVVRSPDNGKKKVIY